MDNLIAHGGVADVYRGEDLRLGRPVALKIFPPGRSDAADHRRRHDEVELLASLNHPGLVALLDAGAVDGREYLVMELVAGPSLADRLRAGPLTVRDTRLLGSSLAQAVDHIHRHGIVHRDVKPANVLLDEDDRPRLADFGIARCIDGTRMTASGFVVGTAGYLAPEQVRGDPVGCPADLYALGLVVLECLTGRCEYPGGQVESAVARLHRPPRIPDHLPADLADVLSSLTATDPTARPTAAAAARRLADRVDAAPPGTVVATVPVQAALARPRRSPPNPTHRPKALPTTRVLALVGVLASSLLFLAGSATLPEYHPPYAVSTPPPEESTPPPSVAEPPPGTVTAPEPASPERPGPVESPAAEEAPAPVLDDPDEPPDGEGDVRERRDRDNSGPGNGDEDAAAEPTDKRPVDAGPDTAHEQEVDSSGPGSNPRTPTDPRES